jgi:catechol 2,3-dioxygenase-like lactoylglutathione lyase family enzyme
MITKQLMASFAVDDLDKAKDFYEQKLNLKVTVGGNEVIRHLWLHTPDGGKIEVYPKPNFTPATFTVLNLIVGSIDEAVEELIAKGVKTEKYEGFSQDEKGIVRSNDPAKGPSIAWFKDPAGNVFAILETAE